jgi:energy-coupling factor transporter ATP-binding protein EcfA2
VERVQVAIARALLVQSRVLVLDEALAGLEDAAANQILGGLRAEAEPRTIIALTERPASLRGHADKIVVLDEGRVVAEGRHDALLAAGGVYAQLCSGRGGAGHGAGVDGEPEWRRRLALADAVEEELMGLSSLSQETVGAPRPAPAAPHAPAARAPTLALRMGLVHERFGSPQRAKEVR